MMLRKNLFIYLIFKLKVEVEVKVEEAINKKKKQALASREA
jgi:hypothetical protein